MTLKLVAVGADPTALSQLTEPHRRSGASVLFLAVDGDYITGQQININGGLYT